MALKKSQLYASLWHSCDQLRGGIPNRDLDALDEQLLARYAALTEAEIKTLTVEEKWFASIRQAVDGEVERLTQWLAGRVKALEERYARPLPELEQECGGIRQEGRGAPEADGAVAVSRALDFGDLVELCRRTHEETRRSAASAAPALPRVSESACVICR